MIPNTPLWSSGDTILSGIPATCSKLALGGYVVAVYEVVRKLLDLHLREAGFFEHLFGLLLAPHRPEPLAALRQRDRHAVHGGDGVEERPDGMVHVVVMVAGARDVLHQVDPIRAQPIGYTLQHCCRPGLIMHHVEGGDKVVRSLLI